MGALRDIFWDSPKTQFDSMFKRDLDKPDSIYKGIHGGRKNMSKAQRKAFLDREDAKQTSGPGLAARTPLTTQYA